MIMVDPENRLANADQWLVVSGGLDLGDTVKPIFGSSDYWSKWQGGDVLPESV